MMNFEDISIGTDIEKIERFEKYGKDSSLVKRIFTQAEIDYCFSFQKPAEHLAVRFCAKEAVYKALSSLEINDINYSEIEVLNDQKGSPYVHLKKEKNVEFRLSLSHGNGSSIASVIVIKK